MNSPEQLKVGLVRQAFPPSRRPEVPAALAAEFQRTGLLEKIKTGDRVVITSGSRGIESMLEVLRATVALVRSRGGRPLILPAMGSHGGGGPQGQVEVLAHLGQTEGTLDAPIHCRYAPVEVGEVWPGCPVYVDAAALPAEAEHVILVGRVKEHTEFIGPIESGLLKMAVVGLGRVAGAASMHSAAVRYTYAETILAMAGVIFKAAPILGGVALVEDSRNLLAHLEVVPAEKIFQREPELLVLSQKSKPKLPFDQLDVLLVDEMGKDISGSGLDTKVIGRIMNIYERELASPRITRLVTLRLSDQGGGNAVGLGLSDFVTRELVDRVDQEMTRLNSVVAVSPEKGRCPLVCPGAGSAVSAALATVGPWRPETLTLAWIMNTKDLEYLAVSPALLTRARTRPDLEVLAPAEPMPWTADGRLPRLDDWIKAKLQEIGL